MNKNRSIAPETRRNWIINATLFSSAVVAIISGIYFLFLPVGGYQGGRNPMYGVRILFERSTWDDLHTWGGIVMIAVAVIHIIVHWNWIRWMLKRVWNDIFSRKNKLNIRSRFNAGINAITGISFLVTALSAIYLLLFPGGKHGIPDPVFLFTRSTWDLIHTWSAIVMIIAAMVHFAIHWIWIVKVTSKIIQNLLPNQQVEQVYQKMS